MIIYLKGEHGIRTAYNETEAEAHEKDGYVRVDLTIPKLAEKPEVKKTRKKRKSND